MFIFVLFITLALLAWLIIKPGGLPARLVGSPARKGKPRIWQPALYWSGGGRSDSNPARAVVGA